MEKQAEELTESQFFRLESANFILNFLSFQNLFVSLGNQSKLSFKRRVTTNKLTLVSAINGAGIVYNQKHRVIRPNR